MRTSDFKRLYGKLSADLPCFVPAGRLLVMPPMTPLLRALHFDDSRYSRTDFYVRAFVMPMYVPTDFVHFLFSKQIGGPNKIWNLGQEGSGLGALLTAIQNDALPFLEDVVTPTDLVRFARSSLPANHVHVMEAVAYSLVKTGDSNAPAELARLCQRLGAIQDPPEYIPKMMTRVQALSEALETSRDAAQALLSNWELQTLQCLKLTGV